VEGCQEGKKRPARTALSKQRRTRLTYSIEGETGISRLKCEFKWTLEKGREGRRSLWEGEGAGCSLGVLSAPAMEEEEERNLFALVSGRQEGGAEFVKAEDFAWLEKKREGAVVIIKVPGGEAALSSGSNEACLKGGGGKKRLRLS